MRHGINSVDIVVHDDALLGARMNLSLVDVAQQEATLDGVLIFDELRVPVRSELQLCLIDASWDLELEDEGGIQMLTKEESTAIRYRFSRHDLGEPYQMWDGTIDIPDWALSYRVFAVDDPFPILIPLAGMAVVGALGWWSHKEQQGVTKMIGDTAKQALDKGRDVEIEYSPNKSFRLLHPRFSATSTLRLRAGRPPENEQKKPDDKKAPKKKKK